MSYRTLVLALTLSACGAPGPETTPAAREETSTDGAEAEAPAEPGHRLALARRPAAGDRWREQTDYRGRTVLPPGRERVRRSVIDARLAVTAADADHDEVRVDIDDVLVQHWRGGDRNLGLPAGTVILLSRRLGGATILREDGTPLQTIFVQQLEDVLPLTLPIDGQDDDAFFQTGVPRAVGERWSIASPYVAESLGGTLDHAEATLERVETVDGVEQAVLTAEVRAHTDRATTVVTWEIVAPIDVRRPVARLHRRLEQHDSIARSESVYETTRVRTPLAGE